MVSVVFPQAGGARIDAELVSSQHDLERGLMYRTSLPADQGMLFDMGMNGRHPFWMRNTCVPLDMIFADDGGRIVELVEDAPPLDDAPRGGDYPARYVLEVNAGWSRRHGVKVGQTMTIDAPMDPTTQAQ